MPNTPLPWQQALLDEHRLDPAYLVDAQRWFDPLAVALAAHHNSAGRPVLVAVNGSQGSGKSTLCAYLRAVLGATHGLQAITLSLDDFYLTRAERQQLAATVHPLLATRGVPGTHDMGLLERTLDALLAPDRQAPVLVPRFDKATDDRCLPAEWGQVDGVVRVVLLEGWCLGAGPQRAAQLVPPVNDLERAEDLHGRWRRYVNDSLQRHYLPLYDKVDRWVMLQAPSFDCVYRWRLEQEQKLAVARAGTPAAAVPGVMNASQLARFVQHYQRLTEVCLATLPAQVDHLYRLDADRRVTACRHRDAAHRCKPGGN